MRFSVAFNTSLSRLVTCMCSLNSHSCLKRQPWLESLSLVGFFGKREPIRCDARESLRIRRREYIALVGSLILISLEGLIRIITLGLR